MHGEFILTMAAVRENYWISKPGRLAKRVVRNCFGAKDSIPNHSLHKNKAFFRQTEPQKLDPFN